MTDSASSVAIARHRRTRSLAGWLGSMALAAGSLVLGAPAPASAAAQKDLAAELAAAVPSGTRLVVAEQNDQASIPWKLSGADQGAPYDITFANFNGGPAVLEALIAGAVDIGYVGDPVEVNPHIVEVISKSDLIPVIAPDGISREGQTLNINADTFASALAARMKAKRLLLLTDVAGVLDKDKNLIPELNVDEARDLIRNGTINGGMIPKIEGCIEVVEAGVEAVVIIDGRVPHCVLLELFTEHGVGTLVGGARKPSKKQA